MNNKINIKKKANKGYVFTLVIIGIIILGLLYIGFNKVLSYKAKADNYKQENIALNKKLNTLMAINKELQDSNSIDGLNQQIAELKAVLDQTNTEIASLNELKASLTKEINTLNSQKATKTNDIANLEARLKSIQDNFAAQNPKIVQLQDMLATYKADTTSLYNYLTEASKAYLTNDEAKLLSIGQSVMALIPKINTQINSINTFISGLE